MNHWNSEPTNFVHWLSRQKAPSMLANQAKSCALILSRIDTGDLISVMYYGDSRERVIALDILIKRFQEEQYWVNESNRTQYPEDENATDWG